MILMDILVADKLVIKQMKMIRQMTRAATKCLLIYGRFLNCTTAFDFSTYNPLQLQEKKRYIRSRPKRQCK